MKNRPSIKIPFTQPHRITFSEIKALLFPTFRKHRRRLVIGFTALIVVDFFQLTIPRIIKHGVDGLATGTVSSAGLLRLGVFILFIAACVVGLRFLWRYLIIGFSRMLERAVRNRIFSHITGMDAPFFEQRTTGELMAHQSNDLAAVQMACGMGMVAAVDALVMSITAIGFMIAINPLLTFFALLPMPALALATRILSGKLHGRFATVQQQFSELTEFSRSTLISIGLIKAYTMENFQTSVFGTLGRKYVKSNLRVARIQGLISPLATLVGSIGMLAVLYFGGRLVVQEVISIGEFVAFISYLYMLIWPMMAIGWVANLVQRGLTSLSRINNLITSRPTLPDPELPEGIEPFSRPGFAMKNLHFSYSLATAPALSGVTLTLSPGIHGVTGRTGSGKSTLCKILTRLYPVENNTLFFGGSDVNGLPLEFMRSHIAYVSQEPILFSDTIAGNLAFGRPEASRKEIERAAESAAVHKDIMQLPHGYETVIGERGVKLSGGQKQRLALARALLCDRPVLILDDGLSAVDVATEHKIFQNLKRHFSGKTVIIVSNRIKLLSMTDRIIILAEGKIETEGDHEKLLDTNTLYQSMYVKQMKGEELRGGDDA
ncbi:ABC transporter ATP-binding protein [Desulforhopalus singaporensis]|uniref:ATP-binding cassette, subfamily B n=1 Tax=Desulforhopalus singaporensis TaxID=91360 RepID=A0A1H0LZU7_9BACT|nr:ABC transporter transmembrane domain-containing protein [Desulforhopalus singaporensis]SDO73677.1 ATP-binding cassette, subfamily B [Desulforhopalus singaporensis]